ncbi:MAG: peptidoglycan-binding protein [Acidimicrobiales bacterium]
MSAIVRPGIYLEDNPPKRSQYRVGRRAKVKPVIVLHTAEGGTDTVGPDPTAEAVARFIQTRSEPGSYHLLGDRDSILQLVRFENEAFQDGTGSNPWAIGISLAMDAKRWRTLTLGPWDEFVDSMVQMAVIAALWLYDNGHGIPMAVQLTKKQSDRADASGFIAHGKRDPDRRSDPGAQFPWQTFLVEYQTAINEALEGRLVDTPANWRALQTALANLGFDPGPIDGILGPKTKAALAAAAGLPEDIDWVVVEKAKRWDQYADAEKAASIVRALALSDRADG